MQDITATVRYNRPIASKAFIMGLELEVESFEAEAGQFVMLRVSHSTDPLLRRPFSIARIEEDGLLLILYRMAGSVLKESAGVTGSGCASLARRLSRRRDGTGVK